MLYSFLAVGAVGTLFGVFIGFRVFAGVLNNHMDAGSIDIYVRGKRIECMRSLW